ncbi:MAG: DUF362 domain-containing protein [Verrucomicrobiia bacterium]|jgi:uncharacterized protein (DUF362 family)
MKQQEFKKSASDLFSLNPQTSFINRRRFLKASFFIAGAGSLSVLNFKISAADQKEKEKPIGAAKGIYPGRVVWVYDREAIKWTGPDDGYWWQANRLREERASAMMDRAICELTGTSKTAEGWDKLFRHLNKSRGKGDVGYKPGEKILIKPNWVGMIYREGHVDLEKCSFLRRHNYMNTAPQLIVALIRQLVSAGVKPADITVCDTLACVVNEFYDIITKNYSDVVVEDQFGRFGRKKAESSKTPLYWSVRPDVKQKDYLPASYAQAEYLINFANLKSHGGSGVTLCAKNHYGSLVRWPVQPGYYDLHPNCFSKQSAIYRPLVDFMGHTHIGGKTVLYLIDGIFSGLHPRDPLPQKFTIPPFNNGWSSSLFASQDPIAIDSVALDFLKNEPSEWANPARNNGVDDYLHEAALANDPPSKTFYDPNHESPTQRLASLGVHEHWNNPVEKKYSRNLNEAAGIELVSARLG